VLNFKLYFSQVFTNMSFQPSKTAAHCTSKEEIRQQIDVIDREILKMFAQRFEYVSEIVKFKDDFESIVAQDRRSEVIELRGKWAEELGLDRETFMCIFQCLVDSNIRKEMEILDKRNVNV